MKVTFLRDHNTHKKGEIVEVEEARARHLFAGKVVQPVCDEDTKRLKADADAWHQWIMS